MELYLCSAFRNERLNTHIIAILEKGGYTIYSPARDTEQNDFYLQNLKAIDNSDIVLAVLDYTGRDFCFEIGYAIAKRKDIIPITTNKTITEKRSMLYPSLRNPINLTTLISELILRGA